MSSAVVGTAQPKGGRAKPAPRKTGTRKVAESPVGVTATAVATSGCAMEVAAQAPAKKSRSRWQDGEDAKVEWARFARWRDEESRNDLMERYQPIVRYVAERMQQRLPKNVELDDLVSAGNLGLKDAIELFDPARGVKFQTYCTTRIRGAILDDLRSNDWVPRLVRSKACILDRTLTDLESDLGRKPTNLELGQKLGLNNRELDELLAEGKPHAMTSFFEKRDFGEEDGSEQLGRIDLVQDRREAAPSEPAERQDLINHLLTKLDHKERAIVVLYYYEAMTMREIGKTLGLSESRVCQLHGRITTKLKGALGSDNGADYLD